MTAITGSIVCKYGVFSGPCFPVFGLNTEIYESNTEKYGPEKLRIWIFFTQCKTPLDSKYVLQVIKRAKLFGEKLLNFQ